MRTPIATGHQEQRQDNLKSEATREPHLPIIRSEWDEAKGSELTGEEKPEKSDAQIRRAWQPVLGLSTEADQPSAIPVRAGTVFDQPEPTELLELSVIVPARNEEDCLRACIDSLTIQSEETFKLGQHWELTVVDDHSSDRTAEIAEENPLDEKNEQAAEDEVMQNCVRGDSNEP